MKMKFSNLLLCLILAAVSTSALAKSKSDVRDVTGCLSKGDSADEFLLTGNDGSTWEVRSSRVVLANHVGHTVTATGVVSNAKMHNLKEDAKDVAKDSGMKKGNSEYGHMKITEVKMVSDSCPK
jgi:ABC-type sugar transport system substrate-binding protein